MANLTTGSDPNNTITTHPQYNKSIFEEIIAKLPCAEAVITTVAQFFSLKGELDADQARWHQVEADRIRKLEEDTRVEQTPAVVDLTGGAETSEPSAAEEEQSTQDTFVLPSSQQEQTEGLGQLPYDIDAQVYDPQTPTSAGTDDGAYLGSAEGEQSDETSVEEAQHSLNLSQRGMEESELSIHDTAYTVYTLGTIAIVEAATDEERSELRFKIDNEDMRETIHRLNRHAPEGAANYQICCALHGRFAVYDVNSTNYKYRNEGVQYQNGVVSARLEIEGVKKKYDFTLLGFAD